VLPTVQSNNIFPKRRNRLCTVGSGPVVLKGMAFDLGTTETLKLVVPFGPHCRCAKLAPNKTHTACTLQLALWLDASGCNDETDPQATGWRNDGRRAVVIGVASTLLGTKPGQMAVCPSMWNNFPLYWSRSCCSRYSLTPFCEH
jgi:hypothetical protein